MAAAASPQPPPSTRCTSRSRPPLSRGQALAASSAHSCECSSGRAADHVCACRNPQPDRTPPDEQPSQQRHLARTLPSFERKPLIWLALVGAVCLPDGGNAEQIEGVALGPGGGGENGDEAIAPEADDIAGERGEVAEQGMEAVHREWFALCRLGAFAGGLAARGW